MKLHEKNRAAIRWVKSCLSGVHACGIEDLLACTQFAPDEIMMALRELIEASEVEVLAPVGASGNDVSQRTYHPATHFRLIRETDAACRWQVQVMERIKTVSDWSKHSYIASVDDRDSRDSDWLRMKVPVSA